MNGRIILAAASLTWAGAGCFAADFAVSGVVVDSIERQTVPFATVRVDSAGRSDKPVVLSVSTDDGTFREALPSAGSYELTVSGTGMRPFHRAFTVSDESPEAGFGEIQLLPGVELEGVDVVAQKPLVRAEIDRLAYNVEDDPDSQTKSVMEVLRKVPMVTVDGQDNISVNGSQSFKVYVNGKPNTMMSNNPKEVLRSLPASSVKSIEVITDPGAKYDAEGVAGIINIVTADSQLEGYNLSVGLTGNNRGPVGSLYGATQVGKVSISGNYAYIYQAQPDRESTQDRVDYDDSGLDDTFLHQSSRTTDSPIHFQFAFVDASYEPDSLNLLSLSLNFYQGRTTSNTTESTVMDSAAGERLYEYTSAGNSHGTFGMVDANIDYQHSFRKKDEFLTLSYRFSSSPYTSKSETRYSTADLDGRLQDVDANTTEHTAQIDYVNPITQKHYVDAGMKFIARGNTSDSKLYSELSDGSFAYSADGSSRYEQRQNILAAYADYQLKAGDFGLKAGVRYEHSFTDVSYELAPELNFDADFDDIVPSVSASYSLSPTSMLKAVYNMRLNRPGIGFLNPFRWETSPNEVSYGNPNLSTEKGHNISLSYNSFSQRFNINASLQYSLVDNGIEEYSFVDEGVKNTTYGNIVKRQSTTLALWANWNPTEKTRFTLNFNGSYTDLRSSVLGEKNGGFSADAFGSIEQDLPWKISANLSGGFYSSETELQGSDSSGYYYSLSLQRSFLADDRLSVTVFASDLFPDKRDWTSHTRARTFRLTTVDRTSAMQFGASISWRFGNFNIQTKKTERSISNDDLMQGGNQSAPASGGGKP